MRAAEYNAGVAAEEGNGAKWPRVDVLAVLAVISFLTLVNNSSLFYLVNEVAFIAFCVNRLRRVSAVATERVVWALLFVVAYFANLGVMQVAPSFDFLTRVVNFSLLCLVARRDDALRVIAAVRYLLYLNLFVAIAVYVGVLPVSFTGHFYDRIQLLGRPINSGILFEANYAGIVAGLLAFLATRKVRHYVVSLLSMLMFTFRTGFVAPMIDALSRIGWKVVLVLFFVAWLGFLGFLYRLGPLALEQRYYVWNSFFSFYELGHMYSVEEVQSHMAIGMQDSPWGESGLNLHSGIFESLLYKGLAYSLLSLLLLILVARRSDTRSCALIVYLLVIATVFSISIGGVNLVSLCLSLAVGGNIESRGAIRGGRVGAESSNG